MKRLLTKRFLLCSAAMLGGTSLLFAGTPLLSAAEGAAPVRQAKENLFPTGVGSTWSLTGKAGTQPLDMTATIASVKAQGANKTVQMNWAMNGKQQMQETYLVSPTSVSRVRTSMSGSSDVVPPMPVIQYPMSVGKSWEWKGVLKTPGTAINGSATLRVASKDKIVTSAGTFNAYRVELKLTVEAQGQSMTIPNSYWFAPGVGLVKQEASIPAGNGQNLLITGTVTKYKIK